MTRFFRPIFNSVGGSRNQDYTFFRNQGPTKADMKAKVTSQFKMDPLVYRYMIINSSMSLFFIDKTPTYLFQVLYKNDWLDKELYHSQQQRKLNQNHKVLQQVLIHSPATKTDKMIYITKFTTK